MRSRKVFAALGMMLCFVLASVSQAGEAMIKPEAVPVYQPKYRPFDEGEKEVYQATWNGMISVATAEVQAVPTVVDGKKVYQVRVVAITSKALDLIWRMPRRSRLRALLSTSGRIPASSTPTRAWIPPPNSGPSTGSRSAKNPASIGLTRTTRSIRSLRFIWREALISKSARSSTSRSLAAGINIRWSCS
jgi:hypothetical protein